MHRVASTIFAPVCGSVVMARRGHAAAHRGSEHCWQVKGTNLPASCIHRGVIRDSAGMNASSCSNEQASAQVLQPIHFSGSARMKYCIGFLRKMLLYENTLPRAAGQVPLWMSQSRCVRGPPDDPATTHDPVVIHASGRRYHSGDVIAIQFLAREAIVSGGTGVSPVLK
jgi:hypothetical protein